MKKHPLWIFIIALVLFFLIAPSAQAFLFKDNVEKARDYIKANMVDNAVDLLKKEIEEKPTNAEAHFELGSIYLEQGLYSQAEQRFKGAVGLDAKFKTRVAQKYMQSAAALMDKENYRDSIRYFEMAASQQPSLKAEIAELFKQKAEELLKEGITQNTDYSTSETKKAENFYKLAFKLNPALRAPTVAQLFVQGKSNPKKYFPLVISLEPRQRTACADYLMDLSNKSKDEAIKMSHMKAAATTDPNRYGDKYRVNANALGRRYLALAWENASWIDKQGIAKKYEKLARKYLGDEAVNRKFAVDVHRIGSSRGFKVKKGQITATWHQIPMETAWEVGMNYSNFNIYFENGDIIEVRKTSDFPKKMEGKKFKISAPFRLICVKFKVFKYSKQKELELTKLND